MEQENLEQNQLPREEERYEPRPAWQVWAARIGLVLFLLVLVIYYYSMFAGGGR